MKPSNDFPLDGLSLTPRWTRCVDKIFLSILAIAITLSSHSVAASDPLDTGKAVVESLHATLLEVMTSADELGYAGRVAKLEPALGEIFDFVTISRIVTGRHWKTLKDEQHAQFIDVFTRLTAATYAANFSGFNSERFETHRAAQRRGNLLVKTAIVKNDGEQVTLDYLLRVADDDWRIVNVIADGVSDLSLKRAEYTAVIKNEGFDSLVAKLNDKVANYGSAKR